MLCRAKINLFLNITGRRSDGYHLLESLFTFADFGDELQVIDAPFEVEFDTTNLGSAYINPQENNVYKAAVLLASAYDIEPRGKILVKKNIPIGAGLGGSAVSAAATLVMLHKLWGGKQIDLNALAIKIGADVPSSLDNTTAKFVSGIGEILDDVPDLPSDLEAVLVWPECPSLSKDVFKEYAKEQHAYGYSKSIREKMLKCDSRNLLKFVFDNNNDLFSAAAKLHPVVAQVIESLSTSRGCYLARMTGSGSACFGLFNDCASAVRAADYIRCLGYWTRHVVLNKST